jgi:hypothetical protein
LNLNNFSDTGEFEHAGHIAGFSAVAAQFGLDPWVMLSVWVKGRG